MIETLRRSRILAEVHETASGLYEIGLIGNRRMGEFDALCGLDIYEMPPQKYKETKSRWAVSGVGGGHSTD